MHIARWTLIGMALGFLVALSYVLLRSGNLHETGDAVVVLGAIGLLIGGFCGSPLSCCGSRPSTRTSRGTSSG